MTNLYFPVCAFFCAILLIIVFFSKKRINNKETKIFSGLLITSFIDSILMVLIIYIAYTSPNSKILYVLNRLDFFQYIFWASLFFLYFYNFTFRSSSKRESIMPKIILIFNIIISILVVFLPMNIHTKNNIMYASGSSVNVVYISCFLYFILILVCVICNLKKIKGRKILPLITLILLALILFIVRKTNPSLLIIPAILAYIDLVMLFTIENPDVKMIYELNKNKKLLESMSEEKSNFLFDMSQETRRPLDNILEVKTLLENEKDIESIQKGLKVIENNARSLKSIINNVLDISNMDSSKLTIEKQTYDVYTMISICLKNIEKKINENVTLRTNISKNIPKELYGDSFKLRQILTSVLVNAAKYTTKGYIEVNANEIVKYDVCRLVITVEDSGCGLSVEKLNELLKSNSDLEGTDLLKMDGLDIDLKLAFKIIKKLGGYINIKSEEGVGSTFTIVIDQKIKANEDAYYSKYLFNKKKVMVVSDKLKTLKDINLLSSKYEFELLTTMFGNDLVQRVKNEEAFDLIILEDEMKPLSALAVLGKIEETKKKFNTPVVVMLKKDKESIKEHYLEDGFDNYILKESLEEEFDRIIKKYI